MSLLAAIDNYGAIYYALTQVTTNHDVFQLFTTQLAAKLNKESPGWATSSYWLLDGARYHTGHGSLEWMCQLGMRVVVTGPYGYLGSPIEMLFGYLKQTDLNPSSLRTGKK